MVKEIRKPTPEDMQESHDSFMRYLRGNPNNFSYWFPHVRGLDGHGISIPKSIVIPVPEEVYKSFFLEREGDEGRIESWVTDAVKPAIEAAPFPKGGRLFIKNGCYSRKFDFANGCLIEDAGDEESLIINICNIQSDAVMKETDGYLELVVREFIEPSKADTPTIYNGMPLRPEMRLFYDFDSHTPLYDVNYWDWNHCHRRICLDARGERTADADTYEKAWPYLLFKTRQLAARHMQAIVTALSSVTGLRMPDGQPNIWSVDFILEEDRAWLIDMGQGWRSAYWNADRARL